MISGSEMQDVREQTQCGKALAQITEYEMDDSSGSEDQYPSSVCTANATGERGGIWHCATTSMTLWDRTLCHTVVNLIYKADEYRARIIRGHGQEIPVTKT
jgi:hypothetical protein